MSRPVLLPVAVLLLATAVPALPQEVRVRVDAGGPGQPHSRLLTGACLEDVNHEVYGGLYSQMLYGESFQEPPPSVPPEGFRAFGGEWTVADGVLAGSAGPGPRLHSTLAAFARGEVGVEVYLPGGGGGNAGLVVKAARPGLGADAFDGYEVALDPASRTLRLGRHRHDFTLVRDVPCDVGPDRWVPLVVRITENTVEVLVAGKSVLTHTDPAPLGPGTVGLRQWQRPARYRNLWVRSGGERVEVPFKATNDDGLRVSVMWRAVRRGDAAGRAGVVTREPFAGRQSQRLTYVSGTGEIGLENQGLNRWGLHLVAGKPYEGYLWLRAERPTPVFVALESADGSRRLAEARLDAAGDGWRRYDFTLTPGSAESRGRFTLALRGPGTVDVGHAFLQPGEWGRFKGLPVRRDVAEGLRDQGLTVLRYGGSLVNCPEYRWKKMIGPRDRRPPYRGTWYPYTSNGWGILDFLDLCEALNFAAIPAFCADETAADLADFVEYVNGPADSPWGRRRAADGHPQPYNLRYLEFGNEERVDDAYARKFEAVARAVWPKDPNLILVVGDFAYDDPVRDPAKITGAASGIGNLVGQARILRLAKEHNREVWFDVHVWTEGPGRARSLDALPSYVDALEKLAGGARHKVVVFELNAGNHAQRRALGNALALNTIARLGERVPVCCSANCLQPDGQNDNGWDQGLLFLNPGRVWLQPPGHVTRMAARSYLPRRVTAEVAGSSGLDVLALRDEAGRTLVLQVVNSGPRPIPARLQLDGFAPARASAAVEELAGPLDAVNTADQPNRLVPRRSEWTHELKGAKAGETAPYTFPPHSFTVICFE